MIITSLAGAALTRKLVECLEGLRLESPFDPMAVLSTSDGTRDMLNRFGITISKPFSALT